MTPQQEAQLRQDAVKRGYNKTEVNQFIQFAKEKEKSAAPAAAAVDEQPKKEGFFTSLAKNVAKPFVRVGTSAYNVAAGLTKAAQGDIAGANEEVRKTRNVFGIESKPLVLQPNLQAKGGPAKYLPTGQSVTDVAGTAAEIASYAVGGGAAKNVVKAGGKGLIKQAVKTGVIEGAATGALQGGGAAAQREDASVGSVVKQAATGALIGGAAGGAVGGATAVVSKGAQKVSELFNTMKPSELAKQEGILGRLGRRLENSQIKRQELKIQPPRVQEATKAGIPERAIDLVESAQPKTREQMRTMLNLAEKGKKTFKVDQHPVEVAGNSIIDRMNHLRTARSAVGKEIGSVVKSFNNTIDVSNTRQLFTEELGRLKVKIGTDGTLKFSNSSVTGAQEQRLLQDIFNKLKPSPGGSVLRSGESIHTLRQRIFNQLDLGKQQNQLTQYSQIVADKVRDFLKNDLVTQSGEAGTKYGELAQKYASIDDALKDAFAMVGKKWNPSMDGKLIGLRAGEVGRRILGNGSANALGTLSKLEDTATANGFKALDNPIDLLWFNDVLEDLVGSSQTGSLRGQVGRGVKDANVAGFAEDAINGNKMGIVKKAYDFAKGITPEEQLRALRKLLE